MAIFIRSLMTDHSWKIWLYWIKSLSRQWKLLGWLTDTSLSCRYTCFRYFICIFNIQFFVFLNLDLTCIFLNRIFLFYHILNKFLFWNLNIFLILIIFRFYYLIFIKIRWYLYVQRFVWILVVLIIYKLSIQLLLYSLKIFLSMRSDLGPCPCSNMVFYLFPIFSI